MISAKNRLFLNHAQWGQMKVDVENRAPEEACGILLGKDNCCKAVIPVTNILHSPVQFRMAPEEQLDAFRLADDEGWEMIAVYHSHPHGIDAPSVTDYAEFSYPGIIYLIWYNKVNQWGCKGYDMQNKSNSSEIPVIILPE